MRRGRVRLKVVGVLRVVGRYVFHGLIGMQITWFVVVPEVDEVDEVDEASTGDPQLSLAEREAWADLKQRLR